MIKGVQYLKDRGTGTYAGVTHYKQCEQPVKMDKFPKHRDNFKTVGRIVSREELRVRSQAKRILCADVLPNKKVSERQLKIVAKPTRYKAGTTVRVVMKDGKKYRILNK